MGTEALRKLKKAFGDGGYARVPNADRRRAEKTRYKKGWEVRIVTSQEKIAALEALIQEAGFRPGRPFAKARQWVLPVYGRDAVRRIAGIGEANG
jgi:hypothetical protein